MLAMSQTTSAAVASDVTDLGLAEQGVQLIDRASKEMLAGKNFVVGQVRASGADVQPRS